MVSFFLVGQINRSTLNVYGRSTPNCHIEMYKQNKQPPKPKGSHAHQEPFRPACRVKHHREWVEGNGVGRGGLCLFLVPRETSNLVVLQPLDMM